MKLQQIVRAGGGRLWAVVILAAGGMVGWPPRAGVAAETLSKRGPSDAYVVLVQADQGRDREDWKRAITCYRDAMEQYRRLAEEYPDWEPDIVQYRITYCVNQIDAITRKTGRSEKDLVTGTPAAAPGDAPSVDQQRYQALMEENQYLHQRVGELQEEMRKVDAVGDATNETQKLMAENLRLSQELSSATSGSPAGAGVNVAELQARLEEAQNQLETMAADQEQLKQQAQVLEEDKQKAEERAHSAAREDQGRAELLMQMRSGLTQEREGNYLAALSIYERVTTLRPFFTEAVRARARCLLQTGETEEAVDLLKKLTTDNPADHKSQLLLGIAYSMTGQYEQALQVLGPVVKDDPMNATAHGVVGAARMGLGQTAEAKAELEKAVEIDSTLKDAYFNLALVYCATPPPEMDKARQNYQRAVQLGEAPDPDLERVLGEP